MAHIGRAEGSSTRLYIGRISNTIRDVDLEEEFRRFGRIQDVDVKRGFAFVEFYDPRDAADARSVMNGKTIHGSQLLVQFARQGPGSRRAGSGGRGGGSGRFGDEGRDAFYDDRYGGGRDGFEDRNIRREPSNRSRDLSPDRYGSERGFGAPFPSERDAQYNNSGYNRGGRPPFPMGGRGRERDLCYNCGREGHIARECREGDWTNRCYTCGEYGHIKRQCTGSRRNPYRSRSRSPRENMIRSRSRSSGYRMMRGRSPPSPDGYIGRRSRSPPGYRRRSRSRSRSRSRNLPRGHGNGRRSPSNGYRRRYSTSPDDRRRSRPSSPYLPRRNRPLPEYVPEPNDNPMEGSSPKAPLNRRHEGAGGPDDDGGDFPIQRQEHHSDGSAPAVVPCTGDSDNDQQNKRGEEDDDAGNPPETYDHEDFTMPASSRSPRDDATESSKSAAADSLQ